MEASSAISPATPSPDTTGCAQHDGACAGLHVHVWQHRPTAGSVAEPCASVFAGIVTPPPASALPEHCRHAGRVES